MIHAITEMDLEDGESVKKQSQKSHIIGFHLLKIFKMRNL